MIRLANESLYVSGAPGTGKSTFCRWVVWLVAEGAVPVMNIAPPDDFVETLDPGLKERLPLLVRLREFWEWLPPHGVDRLTIPELEEAIGRWVDRRRPDWLDSRLVRAHLQRGSALLILDGMHEVPVSQQSRDGTWYPRRQLLSTLAEACPAWSACRNRLRAAYRFRLEPEFRDVIVGFRLVCAPNR